MNDTSPEIAQKVREMFSQKTPEERFIMGCSMYDTSKYLVTQAILRNNPGICPLELKKELFLRFYGDEFDLAERENFFAHLDKIAEQ